MGVCSAILTQIRITETATLRWRVRYMKWFPPLLKGASHMCRSSLCGQGDCPIKEHAHTHVQALTHTPRSVHSIQKVLHYPRVAAVLRQNVDVCRVSSDLSTQHQNTTLTRAAQHTHTHNKHTRHTKQTQYTSHVHTHLCNFCPLPRDSEHLHPIEAHVVAVAPR